MSGIFAEKEKKYPIQGIPIPPGKSIPTRKEINSWWEDDANAYQVSLFVQALIQFKETSFGERLSYFQIAGIHCYPIVSWDGEASGPQPLPKPRPNAQTPDGGYCNHNIITFPAWHRPYMLLFEQVLYNLMITIVKKDGLDDKWQEAAETFRLPYWDWARTPKLPELCNLESINIVTAKYPNGKDFPNPLLKFVNQNESGEVVPMGDQTMGDFKIHDNHTGNLPWSECIGTSRYGIIGRNDSDQWQGGVNNPSKADHVLQNPTWYAGKPKGGTLTDAVGRILSVGCLRTYVSFASTEKPDSAFDGNTSFLSLEYIHNVVHNITGGENMTPGEPYNGLGHMSDVPVAAFDPVFWLHHCNIDRLFAIWQALNPDAGYYPAGKGPENYPKDPKPTDYLRPFHKGEEDADVWTTEKCWNHTKLNYEYDDLALYPTKEKLIPYIKSIYPTASGAIDESGVVPAKERIYDDYIINVIYDRYALNGLAYSILFFLGDRPSPLGNYRQDRSYLGEMYTFSAPVLSEDQETGCDNCGQQKKDEVLSTAFIPITIPLLAMLAAEGGLLQEWDSEVITAILTKELKVVFLSLGGTEQRPERFPKTTYAVMRGQGTFKEGKYEMPKWGNYKVLEKVTKDLPLGYGFDERFPESNKLDQLIEDDPYEPLLPPQSSSSEL